MRNLSSFEARSERPKRHYLTKFDDNVIDLSKKREERKTKNTLVFDADDLQIMTNGDMIEHWISMLDFDMEQEYDAKIGGPKIDAMFEAIEAILRAFLMKPGKPNKSA